MKRKALIPFLILLLAAIGYFIFNQLTGTASQPPLTGFQQSSAQQKTAEDQKPAPTYVDVQPVIDAWAAKQSGTASVMVYDLANKKTNATLNPDRQYSQPAFISCS